MRRIGRPERRYVRKVLDSDFRSSRFSGMLSRAEAAFADLTKSEYAIGCVNGTATLHLALEALGIGPGDEVIVPSLTMSATCFAVLHAGATPVFADVDPDTWQIDPRAISRLLNPRTKAIISVALYGGSPDYDEILRIAGDVALIEDNAEAMGTTYRGQMIGSFGAFSSYSFQSSKHLTAGEGGMLCTNVQGLADDARVLQTLGYSAVRDQATRKIPKAVIQNPQYLRHERLGWNYRMSEVTAAIVLGQVERASGLVAVRARAAQAIEKVLKDVPWLTSQAEYPKSKSSYWSKAYKLDLDFCSWETFYATFLRHGGRGVYAAWALGYQEPAFKNLRLQGRELVLTRPVEELYVPGTTPIAEDLQQRILAFRTNEWNPFALAKQLTALRKTVAELNQI